MAAPQRVQELGPERLQVVLRDFEMGMSANAILTKARAEWGLWKDVPDQTIIRQLNRYRRETVIVKVKQEVEKANPVAVPVVVYQAEYMDPLKVLEETIQLQLSRVQKLAKIEEGMAKGILPAQTKNIFLLTKQLEIMASLQMDVGILKKVPQKIALSADLAPDHQRFMEQATLHRSKAEATLEAVNYLREQKILQADNNTVDSEVVED